MIVFPKIMGIINATPDSFSDGGINYNTKSAIESIEQMVEHGVDIVDIGGESTRPGAHYVDIYDELERVLPIVKECNKNFSNLKISIDTRKYEVAKACLDNGASIINDVSGLTYNIELANLASEYNAELIIMHMKGNPTDMQINPQYNNVVDDVYQFLSNQVQEAKSRNVKSIYVDVGIGFGKNFDDNLKLLNNLEKFNQISGQQVLGISRKSFIKEMLKIENPKQRDIATLLIHTILLQKKVKIFRIHNTMYINQLKNILKFF